MSYEYQENVIINQKEFEKKIEYIENHKFYKKNDIKYFSKDLKKDIIESVKIEGNQLSKEEIEDFIKTGITVRGKRFEDYVQIHNYEYALNMIKDMILNPEDIITEDFVKSIHYILTSNELSYQESADYRTEPVSIRYTNYIPPSEDKIKQLMKELIEKYNSPLKETETKFERICEFKQNFERVHPFIDGNGRTGRFLMNYMFLQNGYPCISIPLEERDIYFEKLESCNFAEYAADKMIQAEKILKRKKDLEYER